MTITWEGPQSIFRSIDQRSRSNSDLNVLPFFTVSARYLHFLLAYNDDTSHMYLAWPKEDLYWFWDQNVKGQGHISTFNCVPFLHGDSFSFWYTMMILWWYDGVKRSKVKGKFHVWSIDCFRIVSLLPYKLRRVKDTPNLISSGSKIVTRLRRRQYDPLIIDRTIGLVLGPSAALYRPFLKHCTLTNKAVGTIWRALSKPPQRRQGPDLRPFDC